MANKLKNLQKSASQPHQFFDDESQIVPVVKLKYHQQQFEIPTKLSVSDIILFFVLFEHVASDKSRNIRYRSRCLNIEEASVNFGFLVP
jgi:hypothetical protein